MGSVKAVAATVEGRVQGVGFRLTTVRVAQNLRLAGWVRNAADGSVEVFAQGEDVAVDQLMAFLRTGPRGAQVSAVDVRASVVRDGLSGFGVRY